MADIRLGVAIDATAAEQGASRVERAVDRMGRRVKASSGIFSGFTGTIKSFAQGLFSLQGLLGGLSIGAVFGGLGRTLTEFSASVAQLSAITGATGNQLDAFSEKAKELGRSTRFSASEAVEAMKLLASSNPDLLQTQGALEEVTQEVLTLATAAGTTLPQAASTVGRALNQFGADAAETARFVNVLAAGAKFGASEIPQTAAALVNAGTAAKAAKLSFEETNAAIQLLAKVGIDAEQAGTKLATILTRLQTSGKNEFNPAIVGMGQALRNMAAAELDASENTNELKEIFGQFTINAARSLITLSDQFDPLTEKLTGTETAAEQVRAVSDDLSNDLKQLGSAAEAARIELAEELEPAFRSLTQSATEFFLAIAENAGAIATFVVELGKLAVSLAIGAVVAKATTAVVAFGLAFRGIGSVVPLLALVIKGQLIPAVVALGVSIKTALAAINPVAAVLTAVGTAASYVALSWQDFDEALSDSKTAVDSVTESSRSLKDEISDINGLSNAAVLASRERAAAALDEAEAALTLVKAKQAEARTVAGILQQSVQSGFGLFGDTRAQSKALREQAEQLRRNIREIRESQSALKAEAQERGLLTDAIEEQSTATEDAADTVIEETDAQKKARETRERAVQQLRDMTTSLKQQVIATTDGKLAALEFNLEHGRMARTLQEAGGEADKYKDKIIALSRELMRTQAEQQFADPSERFRQRREELDRLGLSQKAYNQAIFEAKEALFEETEARSRLTAEDRAQLALTQAMLGVEKSLFELDRSGRLMSLTEQYSRQNALIEQRIALLEEEKRRLEARPASYANSVRIEQINAQVNDLRASVRTVGDDIREAFESSMQDSVSSILRGTATIEDAFNNMADAILDRLADIFAQEITSGIESIFLPAVSGGGAGNIISGLFGGIFGARQRGGPAVANRPYIVGEGGEPEVFIPGTSGQVVPEANVGGVVVNMTINTPDADSFRASQDQIARDQAALVQRAQRFQG